MVSNTHPLAYSLYPVEIMEITKGVCICMRSSIIAPKGDVVIGSRTTICAMTLSNKSIPDGSTAVGVPCRILEKKG